VLDVDIEAVEPSRLCDLRNLDAADETHGHRDHDLVACEFFLDGVAQDAAR
jgi:hypothetical protein